MTEHLPPLQQETLERLRRAEGDGWEPPGELVPSIRAELETRLAGLASRLPEPLWISKRLLNQLHQCERHYIGTRDIPFEWTPPVARGSISHKAIEYSHNLDGDRTVGDLVDNAIGRLAGNDNPLGEFLRTMDELDRAEVRNDSITVVTRFVESFPPMQRQWRPMFECAARAQLCDDRIVLSTKPDIVIGAPRGREATKVIIDMKTGSPRPEHVADLRFYALVEALRARMPPRRVATMYLDSGDLTTEDVSEDMLWAAVDRVVDAVGRLATLESGERDPVAIPSPACRWCPLLADCDDGRAAQAAAS